MKVKLKVKLKKTLFCVLGALPLFSACEKEETDRTDCDKIILKVTEKSQNYNTVDLHYSSSYNETHLFDEPFTIQGNFIEVRGTLYNLCMVRKISNDNNSITLYF